MKTFVLMMVSLLFAVSLEAQNKSFYDFTVKTIDGKDFPLSSLKGKKVLVVNVASKCGLTPQYAQLEKLYEKYKDKDFVIIGFPANNFMGQEPGSNEEIAQFCSLNYDVTFPMMAKISVKGKEIAPLYQWLTEKKLNGKEGEMILGIRGEDLKMDAQNLEVYGENKQKAVITDTEVMGNENNLYFRFGGCQAVARVSKYEISQVGDEIEFVFVPSKLHFFDKKTEVNYL